MYTIIREGFRRCELWRVPSSTSANWILCGTHPSYEAARIYSLRLEEARRAQAFVIDTVYNSNMAPSHPSDPKEM